MISPLTESAVDYAVRRIEDWSRVHEQSSPAQKLKAAELLLQAVGVDIEIRDYVKERMEAFGLPADTLSVGGFWIGFVVALLTQDDV